MAPGKNAKGTGKNPSAHRALSLHGPASKPNNKWTNKEKILIRQRKRETGATIQALAEWFNATHDKVIGTSTICDFLSHRNEWLDDVDPENPPEKRSVPQWPILDKILVAWVLHQHICGEPTTNGLLLAAGQQVWALLPPEARFNIHYKKIIKPQWTVGFAQRFFKRYQSIFSASRIEPVSVPAAAFDAIKDIRAIIYEYEPENMYSMDECGLFWKRKISWRSSEPASQPETEPARISLTLCCNAEGSDRLPIQFIGKSETPLSFEYTEHTTKEWLWTNNKCAWMTIESMVEWLHMFYKHIGSKKVLLLMDSFSVHRCAVLQKPPPSNIRIEFLPAKLSSALQPLRQGIVKSVKHFFLKKLLQSKLDTYQFFACTVTAGAENPDRPFILTVKDAIWWLHHAWKTQLEEATISKCWVRSSLIETDDQHQREVWVDEESSKELLKLHDKVIYAGKIQDPVSSREFLYPAGEDTPPYSPMPTIEEIVHWHLPVTPEDTANEDSYPVEFSPAQLTQVAQSVGDLRFFLQSSGSFTPELGNALSHILLKIVEKYNTVSQPVAPERVTIQEASSSESEVRKTTVRQRPNTSNLESLSSEEESDVTFEGDESGDSEMSERSETEITEQ